jgi:hypothetical protein
VVGEDSHGHPIVRAHYLLDLPDDDGSSLRSLMAMVWSTQSEQRVRPRTKAADLDEAAKRRHKALLHYLALHLDTRVASSLFENCALRHAHKDDARTAALDVRADIDEHVIAANHFGMLRESPKTEFYQACMSNFFGHLYEKHTLASPVFLVRRLVLPQPLGLGIPDVDGASIRLTLLIGVGHCGEHARLVLEIMKRMMKLGNKAIKSVTLSGNVNIDHAFVLVNCVFDEILRTISRNKASKLKQQIGKPVSIIDLRKALRDFPENSNAIFVDAYMQLSVFKARLDVFLRHIDNVGRGALRTRYIRFLGAHPDPGIHETLANDRVFKGV